MGLSKRARVMFGPRDPPRGEPALTEAEIRELQWAEASLQILTRRWFGAALMSRPIGYCQRCS